jgi:hypothetical protein
MSCFTGTSGILQQGDQEIKELNELGIRFAVVSETGRLPPRSPRLSERRAFEDVEAMTAWLTMVSLRHMNT